MTKLIFNQLMPGCAIITSNKCNKITGMYIKAISNYGLHRTTKFAWIQAEY
jgi:hypothetical protein